MGKKKLLVTSNLNQNMMSKEEIARNKQFKNMMSKIWANGVQLSDWVENIVGKEEIALYEEFLVFPQCFQKLSVVDASKCVFMVGCIGV